MHLRQVQATGPSATSRAKRPLLSGHMEMRFRGVIYSAGLTGPSVADLSGGPNIRVNQDTSDRPQNETSVAANPAFPRNIVVGNNDYRTGTPVGGGFAASLDGGLTWQDGEMPFPLLATDDGIIEPPAGTGDPAVGFQANGTAYQTTIGFSFTWCENGVFSYRSTNRGRTWTRPVVPPLAPPNGLGTIVYHPKSTDCTVVHDKEYLAIDTTGGPHDGRLYVTWSKFEFDGTSGAYLRSGINLAYSDNNGDAWTVVGEINGSNPALCTFQADGEPAGRCDENQFSVPIVLPDGTVVVSFENEQNEAIWEGADEFDDQYLVVRVNPDTFAVSGPYMAASIEDGLDDLPINNPSDFRQTVCEANFRFNSGGNIFRNPATGKLHIVFMSHNKNAEQYPFPTFVNPTALPPASNECPPGVPETDTDIYMATSADGGVTWGQAAPVGARRTRDQWFPWGVAGDNGKIYVVYHDRRRDADNKYVDAFLSVSSNSGASWTDYRASSVKSDMDFAFSGGRFIGDYNGIAISRNRIYPVWTDARKGSATVRQSDIYTRIFE